MKKRSAPLAFVPSVLLIESSSVLVCILEQKPGQTGGQGNHGLGRNVRREFENATVVYNPMGNKVVAVTFPEDRRSAASGKTGQSHHLESPDGDMFLKVK